MTVTIVIVVRTIPERQISMYPIVLAIVLPPKALFVALDFSHSVALPALF